MNLNHEIETGIELQEIQGASLVDLATNKLRIQRAAQATHRLSRYIVVFLFV